MLDIENFLSDTDHDLRQYAYAFRGSGCTSRKSV